MLIDPVDAASFGESAGVLGDNAALAQFVRFLFVVSVVLYWFGLRSLHRAFSGNSPMDRVSRFAPNIILVGYAFLVAEHVSPIDLHGVAVASNVVLLFGSLCIVIIGVGIMQGRQEFVGEEAAA